MTSTAASRAATHQGGIEAGGLVKRYGDVVALDGLDLTVPEGTVLGLLGPNGAGKTTAVSILTTLVEPDAGGAVVAGAESWPRPARCASASACQASTRRWMSS